MLTLLFSVSFNNDVAMRVVICAQFIINFNNNTNEVDKKI